MAKNITSSHHKKSNAKYPAWLWFSIFDTMEPRQKWTDEKERMAKGIIGGLKRFIDFNHLPNLEKITEPNRYDAPGYLHDV